MANADAEHLPPDTIARYVDRGLQAHEIAEVENHLASCAGCLDDVLAVQDATRRATARWVRPVAALAVAAAAVLAIVVVRGPQPSSVTPMRTSGAEGTLTVRALQPADEAVVAGSSVNFTWHSLGVGTRYRLAITDSVGAPVWDGSTFDTSLILPDTVRTVPGRSYYWMVDALLPDGRTGTATARAFTIQY